MEIIILWILVVILVTVWADRWGRSGLGYFLLSLILSPLIGGIILLIQGKKERSKTIEKEEDILKKCPQCAEMVKAEARICRFCQYTFPKPPEIQTKIEEGEGDTPKECPQCGKTLTPEATICWFCKYTFPKPPQSSSGVET